MRVRAPIVRIVDHGDATTVIGPRGTLRFDGDSAQLCRAVLEIHARPTTREQLFAELEKRSGAASGGNGVPAKPVDDLFLLLAEAGVLIEPAGPRTAPQAPGRRVVLAISGAVAAVDAPVLVRGLQALGCDVRVALTKTSQRFVSVSALDALTHHQVWRGMWQRDERVPVPHINLAEWAELVIVWPASATTLSRIATGDCSDLVSAIVTATKAPVVIAPSMNDAMIGSPAVQENLESLREHGRYVVHGALGIEVAHRPEARVPMYGPSAPPAAIVDIARHLLVDVHPRPKLPEDGEGWEQLWATTPITQLPWTAEPIDAPLVTALDRLAGAGRRLLDLGTGSGIVAIEAAKRGSRVTATDASATALGHAKRAAGDLPILFALEAAFETETDVLAASGPWHVVTDRGCFHCLPRALRERYAAVVKARTAPGGRLVIVAHASTPGVDAPVTALGTFPIGREELPALLAGFDLLTVTPTSLSGAPAFLYELRRQ